ncbi:sensor histidine kinase [Bacillus massilinigeriensis]|uniref:sensor histidine kinase n=1 Tax=Bacillus mediterraneensis TaxID=1805474 RepID=UPI0008F9449B|nr:histidine kinase [Bacillus mediterraneensis]
MDFSAEFYKEVIGTLPEGVLILDSSRKILLINKSAAEMTGWSIGERVPYCTYCQQRKIGMEEDCCIMAADDPVPFFYSNLAVSSGEEEFEMALKKIKMDDGFVFILRLQRPVKNENSERARFHELLVQETMLAQEAERKRIARDLHDHIGQSVYSLFLGLEGIRNHLDHERYEKHLDRMIEVMDGTLSDIKRMTKALRSETFYQLSLKDALRKAAVDWMELYKVEIELDMEITEEDAFDREKSFHFYRILQEGVRNAVMHGHASSLTITVKNVGLRLVFQILDNGTGFETENLAKGGLGLRHMYERCRILGGDIRWTSKIGGPTRVDGYLVIGK